MNNQDIIEAVADKTGYNHNNITIVATEPTSYDRIIVYYTTPLLPYFRSAVIYI